ncbi:hypothetical protein V6N13_067743 [Hibiscus sabdariffa]|uniref:Uncharacterized protein n=1 Tax=Hibiscus sabdariffa TaxID=183260 RepID=A0ABR2DUF7_9ROSI
MEKLVKAAELVGHGNLGQLQRNEGQNINCLIKDATDKMRAVPLPPEDIQEIKGLLKEIKNGLSAIPPQTLCRQCNQNCWQGLSLAGQQGIPNGTPTSLLDSLFHEDDAFLAFQRPMPDLETQLYPPSRDVSVESFNDEKLTTFLQQWDGNSKREGDFSKFDALQGEVDDRGVPLALIPIETKIKEAYSDITEKTTLSECAAFPTLKMLYATVKEMDELEQVENVSMDKLTDWRDAIIDAQQIRLEVRFAKDHLNKIVYAYFGSKPIDLTLDPHKELDVEIERLKNMLQLYQKCRSEAAANFKDKPLKTGLFRNLYSFD